ncbi:DUF305 domain-containing protein [Pseudonocardia pini]|uniref:DUF305 domain-containing protein n=1 Tax=Pseudonocardia pini TaxID=2758030 RepID=UPI0015F0C2F0|nr:DUF305 domain-containing protein [Pseudonocardia pini]
MDVDKDAHPDVHGPRAPGVVVLRRTTAIVIGGATALVGVLAGILIGVVGLPGGSTEPSRVDVVFAQEMIQHHQQALVMAQIVGTRAGGDISALAAAIEADQTRELGQMQGYLDLWDEPLLPSASPDDLGGAVHGGHGAAAPGHVMAGMATEAELERLRAATGGELETLFLQLMIRHHQGAILMTDGMIRDGTEDHARALAQQMRFEQQVENERMTMLLLQRGAQPLPAPTS